MQWTPAACRACGETNEQEEHRRSAGPRGDFAGCDAEQPGIRLASRTSCRRRYRRSAVVGARLLFTVLLLSTVLPASRGCACRATDLHRTGKRACIRWLLLLLVLLQRCQGLLSLRQGMSGRMAARSATTPELIAHEPFIEELFAARRADDRGSLCFDAGRPQRHGVAGNGKEFQSVSGRR